MKKLLMLLCFLNSYFWSIAFAQDPILKVAVNRFSPPFVLQGAHNQLFGFDIAMMNAVCKIIQRDCQYEVMDFKHLLNAVINRQSDVAVGSIGITAARAQLVNFTIPYLPSHSLFLGTSKLVGDGSNLLILNDKSIGVEQGTIFEHEITRMGIQNPTIVPFQYEEEIIDALTDGKIDFALVDSSTARYWENRSTGILKALGPPMPYGYGLGIAVAKDNLTLLQELNRAILQYQNSQEFKRDYNMYLQEF